METMYNIIVAALLVTCVFQVGFNLRLKIVRLKNVDTAVQNLEYLVFAGLRPFKPFGQSCFFISQRVEFFS